MNRNGANRENFTGNRPAAPGDEYKLSDRSSNAVPARQLMRILCLKSILVFPVLLTGCVTGDITKENKLHMINASPNGDSHVMAEGTYRYFAPLIAGADEGEEWSTVGDEFHRHLDGILENLTRFQATRRNRGEPARLLVYIHGGLNTLETSIRRVDRHYQAMLDDGVYPVFINWRSGAFTSYRDHLLRVRDGEIKTANAVASSPFYLATDVLGAVAKIPEAWVEQGTDAIMDTFARTDDEERSMVVEEPQVKVLHSDVESRPTVDSLLKGGLWVVTSPSKLLTTSAAYSFGKPAWDIMVRRSRELLIRSCEFYDGDRRCSVPEQAAADSANIFDLYNVTSRADLAMSDARELICRTGSRKPVCSGALSVFIKKLIETKCHGGDRDSCPESITLIGHSMGAIVASELLRYFPHLEFDDIVFMGAALNSRDALSTLAPYLQRHRDTRFYNLSLHPLAEDTETNFFGLVPNGSLLTWIDAMYGLPENEFDKTFGQWSNARRTARLIPVDVAGRMHFRVFGFDENEPRKHGEFGDRRFSYWLPEYWGVGHYSE